MVTKLSLDDDFFMTEASVFGLISELPDYRLCYMLNNAMNLKLIRAEKDRELHTKKGLFQFSEFEFQDLDRQITWFLTKNKKGKTTEGAVPSTNDMNLFMEYESSSIPLVADHKMIDYFFWYNSEPIAGVDGLINESLKHMPYVRTFQKINIENSKHIKNLLIEF